MALDVTIRGPRSYVNALRLSRVSVSTGLMMMALGWASFLIGVLVLYSFEPADPKWLVVLVMILTWLSCFLVIAGFAFLSARAVARRALKKLNAQEFEEPRR
jgi:hypothetical protein